MHFFFPKILDKERPLIMCYIRHDDFSIKKRRKRNFLAHINVDYSIFALFSCNKC
jgi:hypothetical protein